MAEIAINSSFLRLSTGLLAEIIAKLHIPHPSKLYTFYLLRYVSIFSDFLNICLKF